MKIYKKYKCKEEHVQNNTYREDDQNLPENRTTEPIIKRGKKSIES